MIVANARRSERATRTVTATEARVHLGDVLRAVTELGQDVIVERSGKPEAVFISVADYEAFRRLQREERANDWAAQADALRAEIANRWQGPPLGDVDEMIEVGQR